MFEKNPRHYLQIARHEGNRSEDPNHQVGAVIVKDNDVIALGHNEFPRGVTRSHIRLNARELKRMYIVHAEQNAILDAARNGSSTEGSSIYVTGKPVCLDCAKLIIQAGIRRVFCDTDMTTESSWYESNVIAMTMFSEAGVSVEFVNEC